MVNGVIFDLDNTLYDYGLCNNAAVEQVGRHLCSLLGISDEEFRQGYNEANQRVKRNLRNVAASHNRLLYMQAFLEQYSVFDMEKALYCSDLYWDVFFKHMMLEPYVKNMLIKFRASGLKIGICTDLTAHIQFRKIVSLGISSLIDAVVTSEEIGIEKPDPKMFKAVLRKLGLNEDETIMVGDDFQKDILGASRIGIKAVWYNPKGLPSESGCEYFQIKSFSQNFI